MVAPTQLSILSVAIKRGRTRTSRLPRKARPRCISEDVLEDQERYIQALGRDWGMWDGRRWKAGWDYIRRLRLRSHMELAYTWPSHNPRPSSSRSD